MALSVLDGNQSATTLSSVVTGGEHIVAHSVVSLGSTAISNITSAVSGSVVTIPSLARIANSAATDGIADTTLNFIKIGGHQSGSNQTAHIVHVSTGGAMSVDATDSVVSISNFPSTQTIAGTVTANVFSDSFTNLEGVIAGNDGSGQEPYLGVQLGFYDLVSQAYNTVKQSNPLPISGTVTVGNSVTIGSLPAISGTVTANVASTTVTVSALPSGALTTRFGSVVTANLAQITSAVTNTSRKYLLIQNVTTGSNVITVGIGFTPTTTQGIQLTAGAGITFESSYIPTGAVQILSSVTASNFTILEA